MLVYLRNGVELGWLIDPKSRTVSIYKTGSEQPVEFDNPPILCGEGPVSGFTLNLEQIYAQL